MSKVYQIAVFVVSLVFSFASQVQALEFDAKSVSVLGAPNVQTRSSIEATYNVELDNNQKITNRLTILKEDGKYYWQSRDRRALVYTKMKGFDLFTDPKTGGYIKIVLQPDDRLVYMEHISNKDLNSFTYWGVLSFYKP